MKTAFSRFLKIALILLGLLLLAGLVFFLFRWGNIWSTPEYIAQFQAWIRSFGVAGGLVLFAIQYVQIVVAFIPGGPIQVVAGALYGALGGMALCLGGMILATTTVFALVQRYGTRVIRLFVKEREMRQYTFLSDSNRLEALVFLLFLIPGAPKDVLTYLFALTPISLKRFLLISTVARIPAAMTSVLAGDSLADGQWLKAAVLFAVVTALSLLGLLLHRKITAFYHRRHS